MNWLARYSTLLILLGSVAWLTQTRDWEPALAVVSSFVAFVTLDVGAMRAETRREQCLGVDRDLFARIRAILPNEPTMRFFREHNYGGEFEGVRHLPLFQFTALCTAPGNKFLISKLERKRQRLQLAIESFQAECAKYVFPAEKPQWCGIPREWCESGPGTDSFAKFREAEELLNSHATQVCFAYDRFIDEGRRTLRVS